MQAADDTADSQVVLADQIGAPGHHVPEAWLRARVRGWMELIESPDSDFWIGTYTADGKWIYCSSHGDTWAPHPSKQNFAMKVCRHLNMHCNGGGAWLAGWRFGNREFYLLQKDADGDLSIPIEVGQPFSVIREWPLHIWENHATAALGVAEEFKRAPETTKAQMVKVAQGEHVSKEHYKVGPIVAGLA